MSDQVIALAVADGNHLSNSMLLPGKQPVVYVNASPGQRFILTDSKLPLGPHELRIKRNGNNLEIALPDEKLARLVILDFYNQGAELQGLDSYGQAHTYVMATETNNTASELDDGQRAFIIMHPVSDGYHVACLRPSPHLQSCHCYLSRSYRNRNHQRPVPGSAR